MSLTPLDNPMDPQPSPSGAIIKAGLNHEDMPHGHSPYFGGEIVWNDIQQIAIMNALIKSMNRQRAQNIMRPTDLSTYLDNEDSFYFPGKLPYITPLDPSGYPQQGYNIHTHVNDFDGGFIAGAGNHDHRGVGHGGFAFACYHPGTSIPLRSYRIED